MIQQTSLEAYEIIRPELNERQSIVYELLKRYNGLTNTEIGNFLGWGINRVTPRVFELRKKGLVFEKGKRKCSITGFNVIEWSVV